VGALPNIDDGVTGEKYLHLPGRETVGTHSYVNFEFAGDSVLPGGDTVFWAKDL
jgi:hypothetical protein